MNAENLFQHSFSGEFTFTTISAAIYGFAL